MKAQGIRGPAYKFLHGSTAEASRMLVDSMANPLELSHNIFPKVQPHFHSWIKQYGEYRRIVYKFVKRWHINSPKFLIFKCC